MDFNLPSSIQIEEKIISNNLQSHDCPLCCKARKVFYCKGCVNNGDYVKSTAPCTERYLR